VRLFLEDLTRLTTKKEVRESLTKSPSTLSEMYRKIMDQIGRSKHARLADRIIRWVIHAGRPLRIHELQHGLAIESGMLEMDKDNLTSRKTILSSCLGLITLDHDGTVRPVHASLFEFLSCDDIDSTKIACTELGRACLSYLSLKIFATGPCTTADELEARIAYHPLAVYAAQSLGYHCRSVEDDFITQLISLLNDEKTCASCVQLFHRQEIRDDALRGKTFTMLPKGQTALQLACAMGLVCTSRQLIGMGHDLTAPDFQGWRPLNTAVCYGHKNIVSMLLEAGALLECHDAHGWTPLIWSVLKGHVDVARVLLNAGADISISDKSGWTAMHWAASIGESDMIAVLSPAWDTHLQQIKQSYTAADKLLDPLPVAVAHSNIPAFGMMLDGHRQSSRALPNKAIYMILVKLNSSLTHGLAARSFVFPERFAAKILDSAICRDHLSTVRLLVGRGAARTTYRKLNGRSAIYTAMLCRTPEIPRLLISHGYDLGSTDRDGYSVLDIAARNGTLEVIKSLLNMSSTSIVTRSGRTSPLHQIWANTRLLLNHGIEVSRSAKQCTAHPDLTNEEARKIQKRLLHCRFEIAELLLGMGADINGLDDKGQSPVFHALTSGIEAVEFFQTRGAIMNSADSAGNNLLHYSIVLAILPET
jgi:ankyrin repeat protein